MMAAALALEHGGGRTLDRVRGTEPGACTGRSRGRTLSNEGSQLDILADFRRGISLEHDRHWRGLSTCTRERGDVIQDRIALLLRQPNDLERAVGGERTGLVVVNAFAGPRQQARGRIVLVHDEVGVGLVALERDADDHLAERFKVAKLVNAWSLPNIHLDRVLMDKNGLKAAEVESAAAQFLLAQNGIADTFTRTQFESGAVNGTRIATLMRRAWNREASGDLMAITKPYWYFGTGNSGTSHGSPYAYDTNVPLLIMGQRWIKPGYYSQYAEVVDIAPTLANLLRVRPPAGAEGRVLTETLR